MEMDLDSAAFHAETKKIWLPKGRNPKTTSSEEITIAAGHSRDILNTPVWHTVYANHRCNKSIHAYELLCKLAEPNGYAKAGKKLYNRLRSCRNLTPVLRGATQRERRVLKNEGTNALVRLLKLRLLPGHLADLPPQFKNA